MAAHINKRNDYLWEILVPTIRNDGRPFRTRYHKVWDEKVRQVAGGLTITPPIKGQWIGFDKKLYAERNIPVRIMCNESDILKIVHMTRLYYEQHAVMFYRLSEKVMIYNGSI